MNVRFGDQSKHGDFPAPPQRSSSDRRTLYTTLCMVSPCMRKCCTCIILLYMFSIQDNGNSVYGLAIVLSEIALLSEVQSGAK